MRRPAVRLPALGGAAAAAGALLALAPPAPAAPARFRTCGDDRGSLCARVTVPLDRTGRVPGRVRLKVQRVKGRPRRAGVLIGLAGGPGQAATPLAGAFALAADAALRRHELVVFDQRGTGASGLLRCPSVEPAYVRDLTAAGAACAARLGPARALYTTRDSIADLEAVRAALGVERISLLGVSYGTKVALGYAMAHPERVERLILDSTVTAEGPDVFGRSSFAALPGALRDVCRGRRCRGITPDPVADLEALAAQVRAGPVRGTVVGARGRRRDAALRTSGLLALLFGSDLDPSLMPAIPAAMRSARHGDPAPILRLLRRVARVASPGDPREFSSALLVATLCEESAFPWSRTADLVQRRHELGAALQALGDGPFAPFDRTAAISLYAMPVCYGWPTGPQPPTFPTAPLPAAPTLMLAGGRDLRTPVADARALAARMSDARVLEVTGAGHSVLGTVSTECPYRAVRAFMAGRPVRRRCGRDAEQDYAPAPVAPAALRAVAPAPGEGGRPGRTVTATLLTLLDSIDALLDPLFELVVEPDDAAPVRAGGLRGGWLELRDDRIVLHRVVYVPGVTVSGRVDLLDGGISARLRIGGRAAARGTLRISESGAIRGRLGGRRVAVSENEASAARHGSRPLLARLRARLERPPRRLPPVPRLR